MGIANKSGDAGGLLRRCHLRIMQLRDSSPLKADLITRENYQNFQLYRIDQRANL